MWHKFSRWLGLAEQEQTPRRSTFRDEPELEMDDLKPNIRKLTRPEHGKPHVHSVPSPLSKVYLIEPRSFDEARQITDRLRDSTPVIMNMQSLTIDLSQRLMDFVGGAAYCLGGRVQQVGDKVVLITPASVEVSAEERRMLQENGYIFNTQGKGSGRAASRGSSSGRGKAHRRGATQRPRI